jgi:LDH2 family malate/lactate/ureidoglycolate dehydrogenase
MIANLLRDEGVRLPGARRQKLVAAARVDGLQVGEAQLSELLSLAGLKRL